MLSQKIKEKTVTLDSLNNYDLTYEEKVLRTNMTVLTCR